MVKTFKELEEKYIKKHGEKGLIELISLISEGFSRKELLENYNKTGGKDFEVIYPKDALDGGKLKE